MVQFLPLIMAGANKLSQDQANRQQQINQALTLGSKSSQNPTGRGALPGLLNMGQTLGWGSQTSNLDWNNIFGA